MMANKILNIDGMTCAACAKAVERVTKKLEGVESASVNIATEKLNISYDENKVTVEQIENAIEKAGYKGKLETLEKTMAIEGMTCAACAKAVERVTKKLPGVVESNVNIATEKLKIVYEPSLTDIADIKRVISKAGYKALEIEEGKKEESNKAERESKSLWKRFIISLIFTAPLLYISMGL